MKNYKKNIFKGLKNYTIYEKFPTANLSTNFF